MKTKLFITIILLYVSSNSAFAQKENYVWYFGSGAGLDFNTGVPTALTDGMLYTQEGCSSISDANGNILFYTNGLKVWDRSHTVMPNGDSLKAGHSLVSTSTSQGALIIPYPGNSHLYYIFTLEDQFSLHGELNYSLIDMTLNGGNGDVTLKNNYIDSAMCEKLCAVRHANNTDIWVMVHGAGNNTFICYLLTTSGISLAPVISNVGPVISRTNSDRIGCMKFSPDGTKIAYAAYDSSYADLFDFDAATGIVSNEKYLSLSGYTAYGIEFSPSSNYLYCSMVNQRTIYQWDITSNNSAIINSTNQVIGSSNAVAEIGALQLGPDGKIYVAEFNFNPINRLGVINSPEMPGILCNYQDTAVSLDTRMSTGGLPNFLASYFLSTSIVQLSSPQLPFSISPNPATSTIQLTLPENVKGEIEIVNVMGESVFQAPPQPSPEGRRSYATIDISGLAKGIYVVRVGNENRKLVVE